MKKNSLVLMMFLLFAAFASTASADDAVLGPFTAIGFGANASTAYQNAVVQMNDHLAAVQAASPPGHLVSAVIIDSNWDGDNKYEITYKVFVNAAPPI